MKAILLTIVATLMPLTSFGLSYSNIRVVKPSVDIPTRYQSSSDTETIPWGCPIDNEVVEANSEKEALAKIQNECIEQVRQAAIQKPEVIDVIQTSPVWTDVNVQKVPGGYKVNGTFFLDTLVMVSEERTLK